MPNPFFCAGYRCNLIQFPALLDAGGGYQARQVDAADLCAVNDAAIRKVASPQFADRKWGSA